MKMAPTGSTGLLTERAANPRGVSSGGRAVPILLLVRELGQGGTERQLTEIAKTIDRQRFAPHVGCFVPEGIRGEELRQAGVPILRLPVDTFLSPSALLGARTLGRYIRDRGIQLVHSFDVPLTLFGTSAARFYHVPVVLSSQRAYRHLTPTIGRHLLRLTDLVVDGVVVNCEAMKRHLIEEEKVQAGLVRLCYNGIDLDEFHPGGRERTAALEDASLVVGVVCALRPEKDLETLVEAFGAALARFPGARLLFVGNGAALPGLQERARRLGITDLCHFEPSTANVVPWLRAIDIFVLPSRSEALSNSLMEAMACGCCPVASRVGGNPELVRHGETGMLFEPGDAAGLADILRRMAADEKRRKSLAQSALRFVRENFALEVAARRMQAIYEELLFTG
jgi:glycosyltransferase involved in cell wall biosynthesis